MPKLNEDGTIVNSRHGSAPPTPRKANLVHRFSSGQEQVIKEGDSEKLGVDFTWKPRTMVLTTHHLWITAQGSDQKDDLPQDYIPLSEVVSIRQSSAENHLSYDDHSIHHAAAPNAPGSAGSKLIKGVATSFSGFKRSSSVSRTARLAESSPVHHHIFDIVTDEKGLNCGRTYTFRFDSVDTCKTWMEQLLKASSSRKKEVENFNALQNLQHQARKLYDSAVCQYVVALLIIFNFVLNAFQAEFHPDQLGSASEDSIFQRLDIALTCLFAAELILNLFGHWFWAFVHDGWSLFDFVVVLFSVIALFIEDIPFFSILRVVRAFRILRVIKRFQSLRRIFNAILRSIVPVINALFIAIMVIAIYTIIGVFLFADESSQFGSFGRAMFTLFELTAFTIWPSSLPAFDKDPAEDGPSDADVNVILFVVSFVAIVSWTLLQVLVAVLLDNFMSATAEDRAQQLIALRAETKSKNMGPFDALLLTLIDADTEKELTSQIRAVWNVIVLDVDRDAQQAETESDLVGFGQVREGLLKLNLAPRVRLSDEDFASATEDYALCDSARRLSLAGFHALIHRQLASYLQRRLSDAAAIASPHGEGEAILQGLKVVLSSLGRHEDARARREQQELARLALADAGSEHSDSERAGFVPGFQDIRRGGGLSQPQPASEGGAPGLSLSLPMTVSPGRTSVDSQADTFRAGLRSTGVDMERESVPTPRGRGAGASGSGSGSAREATVEALRREVAQVRREQQDTILPHLEQLHLAHAQILAALASLGAVLPAPPPSAPTAGPLGSGPRQLAASLDVDEDERGGPGARGDGDGDGDSEGPEGARLETLAGRQGRPRIVPHSQGPTLALSLSAAAAAADRARDACSVSLLADARNAADAADAADAAGSLAARSPQAELEALPRLPSPPGDSTRGSEAEAEARAASIMSGELAGGTGARNLKAPCPSRDGDRQIVTGSLVIAAAAAPQAPSRTARDRYGSPVRIAVVDENGTQVGIC